MTELVLANWWLLVVALLVGIAIAWWIFVGNRKTKVERSASTDVLDEGAERAKRNQALIDKPSAEASSVESKIAAAEAEPAPTPAPAPPAAATPTPEPVPQATPPVPSAAPSSGSDDLKRIKGVGPKLEKLLKELGVSTYAQIASWSEADIDRIDAQLGNFQGRIRRDSWTEQAKFLAAGDVAGFEGKFGSL